MKYLDAAVAHDVWSDAAKKGIIDFSCFGIWVNITNAKRVKRNNISAAAFPFHQFGDYPKRTFTACLMIIIIMMIMIMGFHLVHLRLSIKVPLNLVCVHCNAWHNAKQHVMQIRPAKAQFQRWLPRERHTKLRARWKVGLWTKLRPGKWCQREQ